MTNTSSLCAFVGVVMFIEISFMHGEEHINKKCNSSCDAVQGNILSLSAFIFVSCA